jgi:hypothetical protein
LNEAIGCRHKGAPHTRVHWVEQRKGTTWHYYFADPNAKETDCAYLDLTRAYFSIYSRFPTWDVRYYPGQALGWGHVPMPADALAWLAGSRAARNGIVGVAGATQFPLAWPDGRITYRPTWRCCNYQFSLLVLHTLQTVCWEVHRRFPSIRYVNTDGFIVPVREVKAVADYLETTWGLTTSEKARGRATVDNIGAYRVGPYSSGHWKRAQRSLDRILLHAEGLPDIAAFVVRYVRPYLVGCNGKQS